jgi:hypothetical protein
MEADKNLRNVVDELEHTPVNAHEAQQLNQDKKDRRKRAMDDKTDYQENENMYSEKNDSQITSQQQG